MRDETLTTWLTGPEGLSTRLRALRIDAGLTGRQLAEAFGTHSAKVSRIEHGRQLATPSDVRIWVEACGAGLDELDDLLSLLGQSQAVELSWRNRLQTRLQKQRLLDEPGRDFEVILWEPVLRSQPVPPSVMIPQLGRLLDVAQMPNVRLGIIPIDRQLQAFTSTSVDIYDGEVAYTELAPTSITHTSAEHLATYAEIYQMAWADAVDGNEARSLILAAIERYRWRDDHLGGRP